MHGMLKKFKLSFLNILQFGGLLLRTDGDIKLTKIQPLFRIQYRSTPWIYFFHCDKFELTDIFCSLEGYCEM